MNFSISKEAFAQLLYLTSTIVERKNTMPILANIKLTAENDTIQIQATDLETSFVGTVEAKVKTPGSTTLAARMLYDIVKDLPGDTVNVLLGKNQRVEVQCGQASFKIVGISPDEFPTVAGVSLENPKSVDCQKLFQMFDKTFFSVSTDETRYNINGVYVETLDQPMGKEKKALRFVATDGHRLALVDRPSGGLDLPEGVIIPRKGIGELRKVLDGREGEAKVCLNDGFFTVSCENIILGVRLLDGEFPDYRQVIPVEKTTEILVSRQELLSAAKLVSIVSTDKSRAVKFRLVGESLLLSSSSPEYGDASESLTVKKDGQDVMIGFSVHYVTDILNAMSDSETIMVRFNGDLGPALFRGVNDENYECVVMPMRFD